MEKALFYKKDSTTGYMMDPNKLVALNCGTLFYPGLFRRNTALSPSKTQLYSSSVDLRRRRWWRRRGRWWTAGGGAGSGRSGAASMWRSVPAALTTLLFSIV